MSAALCALLAPAAAREDCMLALYMFAGALVLLAVLLAALLAGPRRR